MNLPYGDSRGNTFPVCSDPSALRWHDKIEPLSRTRFVEERKKKRRGEKKGRKEKRYFYIFNKLQSIKFSSRVS